MKNVLHSIYVFARENVLVDQYCTVHSYYMYCTKIKKKVNSVSFSLIFYSYSCLQFPEQLELNE